MNTTKWAVISRLVKEKNQAKREEFLHSENEKAKQACVVGAPFEVQHVSHVEFDPETHDMNVSGVPNDWAVALLSKQHGDSDEDQLDELLDDNENRNKDNTNTQNHKQTDDLDPKELPKNLSHFHLKWDPTTGDFEDLPLEWQDLLEEAHEQIDDSESGTLQKRMLEDQLNKKDEEEKERRRGTRGALPIDSSILLRAIETPPSSPPLPNHSSSSSLHSFSSSGSPLPHHASSTSLHTTISSTPPGVAHHHPAALSGRVRSHSASSFLNPPRPSSASSSSPSSSQGRNSLLSSSSEIEAAKDKPTYYFTDAGHEIGVETWRLEGKVPIPIPFSTLMDGKLRTGDCYIFLHTCEDDEGGDGDEAGPIKHDLYYWLGTNAPVDLKTLAAFRSVELKSLLGKRHAVYMHRLEQGEETPEFEAIFSQPIQYLEGGTISGLVEPSYLSLNHSDVFIFDIGTRIFIWCGNKASAQKQVRSCEIATKIKYETMKCRGAVEILDSDDKEPEFWNPLGGYYEITNASSVSDTHIKEEEEKSTTLYRVRETGEIVKVEEQPLVATLLDSNSCFILDCETEVYIWSGKNAGNLKQSVAIILAQEFKNVFSDRPKWASITSLFEGEESICFKERFLFWDEKAVSPKPALRPRVQSGAQKGKEFDVMKMMITPSQAPPTAHTIPTSPSSVSSISSVSSSTSSTPSASPSAISALSLSIPFPPAAPGDSSSEAPPPAKPGKAWEGLKKVETQYEKSLYGWKSTANGWEEMEEEDFGQFYSNRCYVYHVIFTPEIGKSHSQVYFWQGIIAANRFWISFKFEILPAIEDRMSQMDGITPSTVQLQQHKETTAFLDLFDGKIIYHESSRGFNVRLYQVRTDNYGRLRASQCVTADLNNLNSGDSFIFWNFVRTSFFVWHGKGSPQSTRTFSISVVSILKSSCLPSSHNQNLYITKEIDEGKETYEFWQNSGLTAAASTSSTNLTNSPNISSSTTTNIVTTGVESKYASDSWLREPSRNPPRLFVCHEDLFSGQFSVTYSPFICQSLMSHNDVLIVDVFHVVFVWSGSRSSPYKKEMGLKTAASYVAKSTLGHAPTTPVVHIAEGHETLAFKSQFLSWRTKAADYVDPFASRPITPKSATSGGTPGAKDNFAINSILKRRHMFGGRDDDEDDEALPQQPLQQPLSPGASPTKTKKPKPAPSSIATSSSPSPIPSSPTPASPSISRAPSHSPNTSRRLAGLKPLTVDILDLESNNTSAPTTPSSPAVGKSPKFPKAPKTPKQLSPSSPNSTFKKIGNADVLEICHSDSEESDDNEETESPKWETDESQPRIKLVKSSSENDTPRSPSDSDFVSPTSQTTPSKPGIVVEGATYSVASIVSNFDHLLSSKEIEARNSKLRGVKRSPSVGGFDDITIGNAVRKSPSMESVDSRTVVGRARSGSGGQSGTSEKLAPFVHDTKDLEPITEIEAQEEAQHEDDDETKENEADIHAEDDEVEENEEEEEVEEHEHEEHEEIEEHEHEEHEELEEQEEHEHEEGEEEEQEVTETEEHEPTENGIEHEDAEAHEEVENGEEQENEEEHTEHTGHDEDAQEETEVTEEQEVEEEHEQEAAEHEEKGEEHEHEVEVEENEEEAEKEGEEDVEKEEEADKEKEDEEPGEEKEEETPEEKADEGTEPEKGPKPKPPTKTTTKTTTTTTKSTLKKPATSKLPAKPSPATSKSKPAAPSKLTTKAPAKPAAPKATAKAPAKPGAKPAAKSTTVKSAAKPVAKSTTAKPAAIATKTTTGAKKPAAKSPTAASSATKTPVTAKTAATAVRKPAAATSTASKSTTAKPAAAKTAAKPAAPKAVKPTTTKPAAPTAKKVVAKAPAKAAPASSKPASSAKTAKPTSDTKKAAPAKGKTKTNAA